MFLFLLCCSALNAQLDNKVIDANIAKQLRITSIDAITTSFYEESSNCDTVYNYMVFDTLGRHVESRIDIGTYILTQTFYDNSGNITHKISLSSPPISENDPNASPQIVYTDTFGIYSYFYHDGNIETTLMNEYWYELKVTKSFRYNFDGHLLESKEVDQYGNVRDLVIHKYSHTNQINHSLTYGMNCASTVSYNHGYDVASKRYIIRSKTISTDGQRSEFIYSDNGKYLDSVIVRDCEGAILSKTTRKRNTEGLLIESNYQAFGTYGSRNTVVRFIYHRE
jgi:hypothetical protein